MSGALIPPKLGEETSKIYVEIIMLCVCIEQIIPIDYF